MNVSKSLHHNPLFQTLKTNFWARYKNTILFSLQPTPWYNIRNCGYFVTSELAPVAPLCKSYFYPNLSNFPSWFITMRLCHLARIQVSNKQHNSFISNTALNRLSLLRMILFTGLQNKASASSLCLYHVLEASNIHVTDTMHNSQKTESLESHNKSS